MKILYIENRAEVFSGGQISLLELLSGIDKERFEPIVLCPGEGEFAERVREKGIEVILWDMPTARTVNLIKLAQKAVELGSIIQKCGADIVHTNGSRAQFYASLALMGRKDIPLIWHARETIRDNYLYDRFLAASAARIICVSSSVAMEKFGRYPFLKNKLDIIYNGVDVDKFKKDEEGRLEFRRKLSVGEKDILMGIVGLIVPLKGHIGLLEALRMLRGEYSDIKLVICGKVIDESYADSIKETIENAGLKDSVFFMEGSSDIKAVLSALDIFVIPSQREGFSRVLLEAMACALPIIATSVSGNIEAIVQDESGILVPYGDPASLAGSIERLLEMDVAGRKKLGENARQRAASNFSIESHVAKVQDLYVSLMRRN